MAAAVGKLNRVNQSKKDDNPKLFLVAAISQKRG